MNSPDHRFENLIDRRVDSTRSVVLRYRNAFTFSENPEDDARFKDWLEKTSIREGVRILPLFSYRDVEIHLMDETTLMHTQSLKSIDGCFTTARAKLLGYEGIVFESGGNTGQALSAYGVNTGLETFFFVPEENLALINGEIFEHPGAHLIAVDRPDRVKRAAHLFSHLNRLGHVPERKWRYEASRFRGCFILEHLLSQTRFDWISQTISAAFGPIGIYEVLERHGRELGPAPAFLGIQQAANCPMYRAWTGQEPGTEALDSTEPLLTRVMYDALPQTYGTWDDLRSLLESTGGQLSTIDHSEFSRLLELDLDGKTAIELLRQNDIAIADEPVEKTGLIALAGTLKEIDRGTVPPGSKVLCCLTSGVCLADGQARPEMRIPRQRQIAALASN